LRRAGPSPRVAAFISLAALAGAPGLFAQTQYSPAASQYSDGSYSAQGIAQLPPLEQLVAPIALYPDPVLALILPAATEPDQIRDAAGGSYQSVDTRSLSPAVQGLSHYPDLARWMADNSEWTSQLGAAFASRPQEVMDGIQDVRRRAVAAGTLQSGQQEQIIQTNGVVQIVPAQEDMVYLPRYNPDQILVSGGPSAISWSEGKPAGPWLAFYPAWDRHEVWSGDWRTYHHGRTDNSHQFSLGGFGISIGHDDHRGQIGQPWHARQDAPVFRQHYSFQDGRGLSHPQTMRGAPQFREEHRSTFAGDDYRERSDHRRTDDYRRGEEDRQRDDERRPGEYQREQDRSRDRDSREHNYRAEEDQDRRRDDRRDSNPDR
jgi:hypothetical protein